jgi:hypothetical protein
MAAILRPIRQNCLTEHGSGHRARVMCAAGVVENDGKPKYALHAFRHFFASWCGRGAKKSPLIKRSRQTLQ